MIDNLGEVRLFLFPKHQTESIQLPPTMKAFEPAIQRAHFTFHNIQQKSSHIVLPSLSDPCDFGLKWHDAHKVYQPILTKTYLHLNLSQNSAHPSGKLDAIVVDTDVTRIPWFTQRCVCVKTVKILQKNTKCLFKMRMMRSGPCYSHGNLLQTPEVEITVDYINISKGFEHISHRA